MSKNALIVLSVLEHKIPVAQVAKEYGVSRIWVYQLLKRHRLIGVEAFKPGSRAHHSDPKAVSEEIHERIAALRHELSTAGLDAGASSIRCRLIAINGQSPAISIIWRSLRNQGLVEYTPEKSQSATCSALKQPNRMKPGNQISLMFDSVITKTFWC
jgi:transposase